eukprot:TRINITY_DN46373_c0_g1_i1.p1 TRINITY_DN46373_c0_g1~~TRINITY_DN46373_c0_g1_i1.p1  ORF type:complete len:114 (+),score=9.57 TRINITY_DN46373_c0_g1_i1:385-726(+)
MDKFASSTQVLSRHKTSILNTGSTNNAGARARMVVQQKARNRLRERLRRKRQAAFASSRNPYEIDEASESISYLSPHVDKFTSSTQAVSRYQRSSLTVRRLNHDAIARARALG